MLVRWLPQRPVVDMGENNMELISNPTVLCSTYYDDNIPVPHYSTVNSVPGMSSNVCYRKNIPEKSPQPPTEFGRRHRCRNITVVLFAAISIVLGIAGSGTGLYFKFSQIDQEISALATELESIRRNFSELVQPLTDAQSLGKSPATAAESCAAILSTSTDSSSGNYWVKTNTGVTAQVYCDMSRTCGGITGGWTRIAFLNMTDSNMTCPPELRESVFDNEKRTCTPVSTNPCTSIFYNTEGVRYSHVCGRIFGYQYGSPDSFIRTNNNNQLAPTIDMNYVDGVSLTRGNPRGHVWTFAGGHCSDNCTYFKPPFVGTNFFCDGVEYPNCNAFCNVPLWNGQHCSSDERWFYTRLPLGYSDEIEMRVCRDEAITSEQTPLVEVELYIQ